MGVWGGGAVHSQPIQPVMTPPPPPLPGDAHGKEKQTEDNLREAGTCLCNPSL